MQIISIQSLNDNVNNFPLNNLPILTHSTYLECVLENFDQIRLIMSLIYVGEVENLSFDRLDLSLIKSKVPFLIGVTSRFDISPLNDFCRPTHKVHILKKKLEQQTKDASLQPFYYKYPSYNEMVLRMQSLTRRSSNDVTITMDSMGQSHEKRDIHILRISSDPSKGKPIIWISGGQHAREWVAPVSCLWFADQLISDSELLKKYDFAIAPLLNPDGYSFSQANPNGHNNNRYFRKNRNPLNPVDLNRNWPNKDWGNMANGGGSSQTYSDIYRGERPASEPEIQAVIKYITNENLNAKLVAGIDVHSFGQVIMHSPDPLKPNNYLLTNAMAKKINSSGPYYQKYTGISAINFYPTAGCMDDWFKEALKIPGFTIELRDKGEWGFALPADQITGSAQELYAAIVGLVDAL